MIELYNSNHENKTSFSCYYGLPYPPKAVKVWLSDHKLLQTKAFLLSHISSLGGGFKLQPITDNFILNAYW